MPFIYDNPLEDPNYSVSKYPNFKAPKKGVFIYDSPLEDPNYTPEKYPNFKPPTTITEQTFPQASGIKGGGALQNLKRMALGTFDVMNASDRALGTFRGADFKDPEGHILGPEIKKLRQKEEFPEPQTSLAGKISQAGKDTAKEAAALALSMVSPTVIGGPVKLAKKMLPKAFEKVAEFGKGALGLPRKAFGNVAEELTNVPVEALTHYGTGFGKGAKELRAAAGNEFEVGQELVKKLYNVEKFIPESKAVENALNKMPPVSVANTIRTLEQAKVRNPLSSNVIANSKIDIEIKRIKDIAGESGVVPAKDFIEMRRQLDGAIGDSFGKEGTTYITALKNTRHQMAEDLKETATTSGNAEYVKAMETLAKKYTAADRIKDFLGQGTVSAENRAESFVKNLFNVGKTKQRQLLKQMDDVFGSKTFDEAKLTKMASHLGMTEEKGPKFFPNIFNGRFLAGGAAATAAKAFLGPLAGPLIAAPTLMATSPRIASGTLGLMKGTEDATIKAIKAAMELYPEAAMVKMADQLNDYSKPDERKSGIKRRVLQ